MRLYSVADPWKKLRTVNETSSAYRTIPLITTTRPTGAGATATGKGVIDFIDDNPRGTQNVRSALKIMFFGTGTNNETFSCRFYSWAWAGDAWISDELAEVEVTLSDALAGSGSLVIPSTDLAADTITLTANHGISNVTVFTNSPAADTPAYLMLSTLGAQIIEPIFKTGSSADSCNLLWRVM